jgi:hypothetical protein
MKAYDKTAEANAALIATAPNLYEALESCADILHRYSEAIDDYERADKAWWDEVRDRTTGALAKARGGSNAPDA